jgi:hypothetical protein
MDSQPMTMRVGGGLYTDDSMPRSTPGALASPTPPGSSLILAIPSARQGVPA